MSIWGSRSRTLLEVRQSRSSEDEHVSGIKTEVTILGFQVSVSDLRFSLRQRLKHFHRPRYGSWYLLGLELYAAQEDPPLRWYTSGDFWDEKTGRIARD